MKRVAIIQARMTSTRLPGKVLADIAGKPMLSHVIARLRLCRSIDRIVIATTELDSDDPIVRLGHRESVDICRGDENDVLARYHAAAKEVEADVIVRITADCPLIDPSVVDRVIDRLAGESVDYASNTRTRTFPRGLDTEAFHFDVLARMSRLSSSLPSREHVTWFLHHERPDLFSCSDVVDQTDNSDLRWTVDTADDLRLVRTIYALAEVPSRMPGYGALVALCRSQPSLLHMNEHVHQKVR